MATSTGSGGSPGGASVAGVNTGTRAKLNIPALNAIGNKLLARLKATMP